jgi:hypothetical protein
VCVCGGAVLFLPPVQQHTPYLAHHVHLWLAPEHGLGVENRAGVGHVKVNDRVPVVMRSAGQDQHVGSCTRQGRDVGVGGGGWGCRV